MTGQGASGLKQKKLHINQLELLAALFTLKALCAQEHHVHIQIRVDNTTAMAYINNMGGKKQECNDIARKIWQWCIEKHIWLSSCFIPGVLNVEADEQSRIFHDNTEWKLERNIFLRITNNWGMPDVDLFASRLNYQIKPYVSWKPDPEAANVDAFSFAWGNKLMYIFPPFNLCCGHRP